MSNAKRTRTRQTRVVLVDETGRRRPLSRRQSALALAAQGRAELEHISLTDALREFTAEVDDFLATAEINSTVAHDG